jgi:hypothetical protein
MDELKKAIVYARVAQIASAIGVGIALAFMLPGALVIMAVPTACFAAGLSIEVGHGNVWLQAKRAATWFFGVIAAVFILNAMIQNIPIA